MNPASLHRHRITLLIFVSGAVLLALEIAGSRVLAPFFGSSVFVWGSLIGIFLGSISGGYLLGGWLSKRWPRQVLLNALLAAAGGFTLLLPLWAGPFCQAIAVPAGGLELGPRYGPLFATLILFALPSVLIGVAPPFAVRLLARDVAGVGAVAGQLYAIGTLGNIAGTLVTAFWLIPLFGIHNILTGIGALLVATAVFTLPLGRPAVLLLAGGALLLAVRLAIVPPVILAAPAKGRFEIIEERDSPYTHMRVVQHWLPIRTLGEQPVTTYLKFGKYIQGGIFVNPWQQRGREHWSTGECTDMFHLVRLFAPDMQRVLFVGGGVGAGPRSFHRHYPEVHIDLVEIDPVVVELARKHFFLVSGEKLAVHVADGRNYLRRHPDLKWDAIILDAFSIGGRLPFHLMTREFLEEVKTHLSPNGVVLTNIASAFTGKNGRIFRWEYLTYREVFPSLYVFPCTLEQEMDRETGPWWARRRNIFLAATQEHEHQPKAVLVERAEDYLGHPGRAPPARHDTELYHLLRHTSDLVETQVIDQWFDTGHRTGAPVDFSNTRVLTDDYAPVDTMDF